MRIETSRHTERFGAVRLHDAQKVLLLDSGGKDSSDVPEVKGVEKVGEEQIRAIEKKMAVIIPIRDEKLKIFEGVISGVPHDCLLVVVSNSQRGDINRFKMERDALAQFCYFAHRSAIIIHQRDPLLTEALRRADYSDLLNADGLVRDGKCEGMIIGLLLATMAGKEYIGFVDADNYFPGAVLEYIRAYAVGFSLSESPYAMVRILWKYKPKVSADEIYFKKWGRVSEIDNKYFNMLLSARTGFETDIIKTANAGEHAMTTKLAEIMPLASGYMVEPQELIFLFEQFGGVMPTSYQEVVTEGVDVFQIETQNPHLHEQKGEEHMEDMLAQGLGAIYHSSLCEAKMKKIILEELKNQAGLEPGEEPPKPFIHTPLCNVALGKFKDFLLPYLSTYRIDGTISKSPRVYLSSPGTVTFIGGEDKKKEKKRSS
ncbi:MAG: hypothetical protein DDT32_01752 [Syntrophomonadaceae bacterium]|nr:hypothetical protein [Bacillota bacterium]